MSFYRNFCLSHLKKTENVPEFLEESSKKNQKRFLFSSIFTRIRNGIHGKITERVTAEVLEELHVRNPGGIPGKINLRISKESLNKSLEKK